MLETYLAALDEGYFEIGEAFKGLKDENVWKRPAPGLLSIGEMAGHVAYWEAVRYACDDAIGGLAGQDGLPDLTKCRVASPLVDHRFRYYTTNLDQLPSAEHLAMTAAQVHAELVRVHNEAMAALKAKNPDLSTAPPGRTAGNTYRAYLTYSIFHVAYHTGQIYSARHFFGEETVDN